MNDKARQCMISVSLLAATIVLGGAAAPAARSGGTSQRALACVSTRTSYPNLHMRRFNSISATSPTDVWVALGPVAHWDGRQWQFMSPSSDPRSGLVSISALSPTDVWAVGLVFKGHYEPLIEHWNGTRWSIIPLAARDQQLLAQKRAAQFDSVAGAPSGLGWIVGWEDDGGHFPLTNYWDGRRWRSVASPVIEGGGELWAASALSSTDAWAVGTSGDPAFPGIGNLIEHWDGTGWRVVQGLPDPTRYFTAGGVVAVSARDVWAVGSDIEHWDGTTWHLIPRQQTDYFDAVAAAGPHDIWAVGLRAIDAGQDCYPLLERFTGPGC